MFYLDPPYFKAEQFYQGFAPADHERLQAALGKIQGRFVLSYNDAPEIRRLYAAYHLQPVQRSNSLASKTKAGQTYKELIITNY